MKTETEIARLKAETRSDVVEIIDGLSAIDQDQEAIDEVARFLDQALNIAASKVKEVKSDHFPAVPVDSSVEIPRALK